MASLVAPLQCDGREVTNAQVVQVRCWWCAPGWCHKVSILSHMVGVLCARLRAHRGHVSAVSSQKCFSVPAVLSLALTRVFAPFNRPPHSELSGSASPARRRRARHVRRACGPGHTHGACPPSTRRRTRRDCTHEATTKVLLDSEAKLEAHATRTTPVCILHRLRSRSTATASTLTHANSRTASLGHPGRSG